MFSAHVCSAGTLKQAEWKHTNGGVINRRWEETSGVRSCNSSCVRDENTLCRPTSGTQDTNQAMTLGSTHEVYLERQQGAVVMNDDVHLGIRANLFLHDTHIDHRSIASCDVNPGGGTCCPHRAAILTAMPEIDWL